MQTTPLHSRHAALGAKMGAFAGYDMPLYYPTGVVQEHEWTRNSAGLFDVSHMGQVTIAGPGVVEFLQKITPSSYAPMAVGQAKYTVMTNDAGGIVDDLIVTRCGDDAFFCVINAGCKEKDLAWIKQHLPAALTLKIHDDYALLALQGPLAEKTLADVLQFDLSALPYMTMLHHHKFYISRLGYTGEDGFEISVPAADASALWDALCAQVTVKPVGLAARDSLRLEMGYCLYGHDIDDETTPREAGLGWVMSKLNTDYIGAAAAAARGVARQRVGLRLTGPGIAREGAAILDSAGMPIGRVTSGGFSPTLKTAIAQGYVAMAYAALDTAVQIEVRGKLLLAVVSAMPFVAPKVRSQRSDVSKNC